jgi:hypothetical protein
MIIAPHLLRRHHRYVFEVASLMLCCAPESLALTAVSLITVATAQVSSFFSFGSLWDVMSNLFSHSAPEHEHEQQHQVTEQSTDYNDSDATQYESDGSSASDADADCRPPSSTSPSYMQHDSSPRSDDDNSFLMPPQTNTTNEYLPFQSPPSSSSTHYLQTAPSTTTRSIRPAGVSFTPSPRSRLSFTKCLNATPEQTLVGKSCTPSSAPRQALLYSLVCWQAFAYRTIAFGQRQAL